VFIRHPEPQLKRCYSEPQLKEYHVLNPYPEPQLKGYVPSHNSRNSSNLTSKHYQKLCRTPYEVQQLGLTAAKLPSGGHVPLGATASRPPGAISERRHVLVCLHSTPRLFSILALYYQNHSFLMTMLPQY